MVTKKTLTDIDGTLYFPITHTTAVIDDNGNNIELKLSNYLTAVPANYHKSYRYVILIEENAGNVLCPAQLLNGEDCNVIYKNEGEEDLYVLVSTSYATPDGTLIELVCPAGGYCEVNYLKMGDVTYARGA